MMQIVDRPKFINVLSKFRFLAETQIIFFFKILNYKKYILMYFIDVLYILACYLYTIT
jgi:hypothetical protein